MPEVDRRIVLKAGFGALATYILGVNEAHAQRMDNIIQQATRLSMLKSPPAVTMTKVDVAEEGGIDCPIFMFHEVNPLDLEWIIFIKLVEGRLPVDIRTLAAELRKPPQERDTRPKFCLTFDDGLLSGYTQAFPILSGWRVPATFFVIGIDWAGKGRRYMSPEQKREIADYGFEIGWHTYNHAPNLVALRKSNLGAYQAEIDARKAISDFVGQDVVSFSSPNSVYDDILRQDVINLGYQAAVSTAPDQKAVPTIRTVDSLYNLMRKGES